MFQRQYLVPLSLLLVVACFDSNDSSQTNPSSQQLETSSSSQLSLSSSEPVGNLTIDSILRADDWAVLFPRRYGLGRDGCKGTEVDFFTYQSFIEAAKKFPRFAGEGSNDRRKRELAAFLANISHETTGGGGDGTWCGGFDKLTSSCLKYGLCYREEVGCEDQISCSGYGIATNGTTYHGRGPMQLSYTYNYCHAADSLGYDLCNDPSILIKNATASFESAIWFWMTEQAPKPSCHDIMVYDEDGAIGPQADPTRPTGFGLTVNVINGGVECGSGTMGNTLKDRQGFYKRYLLYFGLDTSGVTNCANMPSY